MNKLIILGIFILLLSSIAIAPEVIDVNDLKANIENKLNEMRISLKNSEIKDTWKQDGLTCVIYENNGNKILIIK